MPISHPAPLRIAELTHNRITLDYDPRQRGWIKLNLSTLDSFRFNADQAVSLKGLVRFKASGLVDHQLVMTAEYPGPKEGALASAAGLLATGAFFYSLTRRRPEPHLLPPPRGGPPSAPQHR